jgi:hypothetical protein
MIHTWRQNGGAWDDGSFFLWRLFVFFYLTFGYFWGLTMFSSMIFGGLAGSF